MKDAYGRVIDIISANEPVNWRAIGLALAKSHPQAFLALHDSLAPSVDPMIAKTKDLNMMIAAILKTGNKVEAIKECRRQTNAGLKEAKDYVDAFKSDENGNICFPTRLPPADFATIIGARRPPTAKPDINALLNDLLDIADASGPKYPDEGEF